MKSTTKDRIWNWVMLIGFLLVLVAFVMAYEEVHGAKKFCKSIDGIYSLKVYPLPVIHSCSNESLFKYSNGWDFNRTIIANFTIVLP